MESRIEMIDNQLMIIIEKYRQLKMEYDKNQELLNMLTTPKVGQKRKRYQI